MAVSGFFFIFIDYESDHHINMHTVNYTNAYVLDNCSRWLEIEKKTSMVL